jgi:hypothetical protein
MYWLETLVTNNGIHNFLTAHSFTPFQQLFLANGLRFICTPPKTKLQQYQNQFLTDEQTGWMRFQRSLTQRFIADSIPPSDSLESNHEPKEERLKKFSIPPTRFSNSARLDSQYNRAREFNSDFHLFDQFQSMTYKRLDRFIHDPLLTSHIAMQRSNYTRHDSTFISTLITDPLITIKPADKNLGMVMVDSTWYEIELKRMLSDTNTYRKFNKSFSVNDITYAGDTDSLKKQLFVHLDFLSKYHESTLESHYPHHHQQMKKFLDARITRKSACIPTIYLLLKVHKLDRPLSGRPIVPCTNWITTPASVLADHILQDIMKKANCTWLVKDTKSLVNELESLSFTRKDGVFVTADIASLYTNIDTSMGLRLIEQFLTELDVAVDLKKMVIALLTFVMHNSYLEFLGVVYHQIDGTAMGTAVAPIYANIIVYMLERSVIARLHSSIYIYRRFLDDVFVYMHNDAVDEFMSSMNSLHPKLKFEFVRHSTEASFLDLLIYKGERFAKDGRFDLRVHQKKMNLYLYIPFLSFHTDAAKKSWIVGELQRYIRNSSSIVDYMNLKSVFYQRLLHRGYPHRFLLPLFNTITYHDRVYFLSPSTDSLHSHPLFHQQPPMSLCLLNRIRRETQSNAANNIRPLVFVIPYTPLSHLIPTRSLLLSSWSMLAHSFSHPPPKPIIAYQSYPSIAARLVFQKAKEMEKQRKVRLEGESTKKLKQSRINFLTL